VQFVIEMRIERRDINFIPMLMSSKKLTVLCLILLQAFSCSEKVSQPSISKESKTASPKIIVLADLPDSSQPVKIVLKKPLRGIKAGKPIIHAFLDSGTHMVMPPEEQAAGFFTHYTTKDGLALDAVWCSATDKDGNLWFGTDGGGVSRFDGQSFTNYTMEHGLLSNSVGTITQDKNGDLWFGTPAGASRFDGRSFTNYDIEDSLANNMVVSIFKDNYGILWFGTMGGGLSRYDGEKFINLTTTDGLVDNNVSAIAEDKSGNLWIGTRNGISRYDGKRFTNYTSLQLRNNFITGFAEDNQSNIWVSTESGLFRYSIKQFSSDSGTAKFPTKNIRQITKDRAGNLWISIRGDGVMRYDGRNFTRFTTTNGLSTNNVESISEDKTGNLWLGTLGGGIIRYGGKSFMNYTAAHGLGDYAIFGISEDKAGDIWFGNSGRGVVRYDGKSFSTYTTSQGLAHNGARPRIKDKKGNLWIATGGGVSCFDGQSFTNYTQADGLCSNAITCIAETRNGKIWFGSGDRGVTCYDGNSFTSYSKVHGLPGHEIRCITEDAEGGIWFGTPEGVARFDGSSFINYSTANGLPNNPVQCFAMDRAGNLWFGTEGGGVSRFDGKSFMNFKVVQGLPDNTVWSIAIDSAGKIIFGTNSGLAVLVQFDIYPAIEKEPLTRPAQNDLKNDDLKNYTPHFEIYNVSAGYPIRDVNPGTMIEDSKGNLWMGTGAVKTGLIRFNYSSVHKGPAVPVLHSVKIHNENVCWQDLLPQFPRKDSGKSGPAPHITEEATTFGLILTEKARDSMRSKFKGIKFDSMRRFYPIPENLVLPYRHNNISVDFGSIELNSPNLVRYQYVLEGYDKDWSPVTEKTSASFGNISEGMYKFKLKARSPEGIWSEPVSYSFKVSPPWWRTWWFRTIAVIGLVLLLYGIYRWRTATLRKQKRKLEQTVKERTAEVVEEKAVIERQKDIIQSEKEKSDELLLNILPSEVAEELKEKGYTTAKAFDEVTVLFSDIKGFTHVAEKLTAQELVKEINTYFSSFDNIMNQFGLEKIKTIGDAYIAAGGLPEGNKAAPKNVVEAAIAMQQVVENLKQERVENNLPYFELRIGIHTGPVVAGVVGIKKFQYDIWGDTVNLAARMEQSGVPGKINISEDTYELVKEKFTCVHRGKVEAKNKGEIDMYFVDQIKPISIF
jgi:ligand-binding sensor domain-containing protein/class 3 adenylate cyclase